MAVRQSDGSAGDANYGAIGGGYTAYRQPEPAIAALIAADAAPASYVFQVAFALEAGVTPEEILGLLVALNPTVGNVRIVAAAAEVAFALDIALDLQDS